MPPPPLPPPPNGNTDYAILNCICSVFASARYSAILKICILLWDKADSDPQRDILFTKKNPKILTVRKITKSFFN